MGGPGPHGQDLGTLKCVSKSAVNHKVTVSFSSNTASASFTLSEEDAEYFVIGESYNFSAVTP